jgi:hypothetical protein
LRAPHGRFDLGAVSHDAGIAHQGLDLGVIEARDDVRVEARERAPEGVAFPQDRDPGQPGLEAVEDQLLEQGAVVVFGHPPLGVVIGDIEGVGAGPPAARPVVGMLYESVGHGPDLTGWCRRCCARGPSDRAAGRGSG